MENVDIAATDLSWTYRLFRMIRTAVILIAPTTNSNGQVGMPSDLIGLRLQQDLKMPRIRVTISLARENINKRRRKHDDF